MMFVILNKKKTREAVIFHHRLQLVYYLHAAADLFFGVPELDHILLEQCLSFRNFILREKKFKNASTIGFCC